MTACLVIDDQVDWFAQSGVFDIFLEHLSGGTRPRDVLLGERIRGGMTDVSIGFVDLSLLDDVQYECVATAAREALASIVAQGTAVLYSEAFSDQLPQIHAHIALAVSQVEQAWQRRLKKQSTSTPHDASPS